MIGAIPVVVCAAYDVAPGIKQFTLSRVDGAPLPAYSAGSHVVAALRTAHRVHRNPYSLMGDPRERDAYQIAVRRQTISRGGSDLLHDAVRVGTSLEISHPVNLFPIARLARRHILIAGGIGVTPILAHAHELSRLQAEFEIHYAYRTPDQSAYATTLLSLARGHAHFYCDSAGAPIDFHALLADRPLGTHVYICGPEGFIASARETARKLGWPASHVHSERFLAPPIGEAFEVFLARSEKSIEVAPQVSLLEAIEAAGIAAPHLCRGGACGQCETQVVEVDGEIVHHDVFLDDDEKAAGRKIMLCVSRLRGRRIVLNL